MPSLVDLRGEIHRRREDMHRIYQEAGSDLDFERVTSLVGTTYDKVLEFRRMNDELDALVAQEEHLALAEQIAKQNGHALERASQPVGPMIHPGENGHGPRAYEPKTLRQSLETNREYRAFRDGTLKTAVIDLPGVELKTLVTLSTVNAQATRQPMPVDMALEDRTVIDLMLQSNTSGNTIEYYEETTFTNNAATVAEGGTKPESAIGYTLRTEAVRKIAHWIPATKEALDDVAFLEGHIRGRLAFGVQRIEEQQVLTGDGVAPNLRGILNRTGVQTQAKGADPTPDAIYKAMQLVRGSAGSGFAEPTAVVMHPADWVDVKLLRTADGIYIWGNPSDDGPDRIWGKPVRQTTAMTQNTALVGAFRPYAEVIRREGIQITISTEHSTYFVENKVAILAESRLALAVYRPSAFCTVTGI